MTRKTDEAMKLQAVGDEALGFKVGEIRELPDVSGRMWRMKYVKNGADLVWIETEDINKTFAIAFRTLPDDDTGVAHIIEHSVLCGSEKFPVKDPFMELHKSSVATYIDACTRPDVTYYPVCTSNNQDLLNLAEVYLDAVFAPLSLKNDWAMPQERNVVLNEMKGTMSSPGRIAIDGLLRMLFPYNAYGCNSGGDPMVIPTLTHKKYRSFYERFYHPSNARIFLYGKVDLMPILKIIASYLVRYERREVPPMPPFQPPITAEKTIEYKCDTVLNRKCMCDGWVFGTWRDREMSTAMIIICDLLAGSNDAPLTKALLDADVCEDFEMRFWSGYQNYVSTVFINLRDGKMDEARRIFRETLERLVRDGFDHKRIAAKLNHLEFLCRLGPIADPPGLSALRSALESWLYGGDPAEEIEFSKRIESLRSKNGTGYYEQLVAEALLQNPHHATLIMNPTNTSAKENPVTSFPVANAPEDNDADLAKFPRLRLADIPEKANFTECKVSRVDGVEVIFPNVMKDGISSVDLAFSVADLTDAELLDLPLLASVFNNIPAGGRDVSTLRCELESRIGGLSAMTISSRGGYFLVCASFLRSHADDALRFIKEILFSSDFTFIKEIDAIRRQKVGSYERHLLEGGGSMVGIRALRMLSKTNHISEIFDGLSQYCHLKNGMCGDLAKLAAKVFVRSRLTVFASNPPSDDYLRKLIAIIPAGAHCSCTPKPFECDTSTSASDSYSTKGTGVSTAMCTRLPDGVAYFGALDVARSILANDYLWNKIRVKGGTYGASMCIDWICNVSLTSFCDPRPEDSFGVFEKCGAALREFVESGRSIEEYQISAAAATAQPLPMPLELSVAIINYLSGITPASQQKVRSEILHTTADDLLKVADLLDQVLANATRCVIGEEALVKRCGLPEFKIEDDLATSCGKGGGVV